MLEKYGEDYLKCEEIVPPARTQSTSTHVVVTASAAEMKPVPEAAAEEEKSEYLEQGATSPNASEIGQPKAAADEQQVARKPLARPQQTFQHPVTPFQEKHMVESLDVQSVDPAKTVLFYNMLNQGLKRGK